MPSTHILCDPEFHASTTKTLIGRTAVPSASGQIAKTTDSTAPGRAPGNDRQPNLDFALRSFASRRLARLRNSCHSGRQPTHDLVVDRLHSFGPIICADAMGTLRANQNNLIAYANIRPIGDVDHELVHGHHTEHRTVPTTDEHRSAPNTKGSRHAIRVPQRDRRHPHLAIRHEPVPVGNTFAGPDGANGRYVARQ